MNEIKFAGRIFCFSHMFFAVMLFFSVQAECEAQRLVNQLKDSPSPYLAIHGEDPVAWQEWSPATLELAREQNKLLFVSIGYFSCHWCHVMQAESYRNAGIAALINQNFIPVKVDRELNVALDAEMVAYAQDSLGAAGWPLNVFITPEGYPLYAILYEQPARFRLMLESLGNEWSKDSSGLKAIAKKSLKENVPLRHIKPSAAVAERYRKQLVTDALAQADLLSGGLNVPRKFPLAPQLAALLEIEAVQHDARLAAWLRLTLDQMMDGGLRDHVAGGFFRYTVDPDWQRPHFEKMLYDNAQLAVIYLRAARIFNQPVYKEIAIETLDFMLADMQWGGGFVTSISALNDRGKEGGVYLWTEAQLKEALRNDEYQLIAKIWGMDTVSEFESGYLPMNRNKPAAEDRLRLEQVYSKLLHVRRERVSPKDIKLLAGLNGLALDAFTVAAEIAPRFRHAADELRGLLLGILWHKGALQKGMSGQQLLGPADLEGYAYVASALEHYARLVGSPEDAQVALQIAQQAWQKFYTANGFVLEQRSGLARPFYQGVIEDGPLPSPSSVLIDTSLRLGDKSLREKARDALAFGEALNGHGVFWQAGQVSALSRLFEAESAAR